MSAENAPDPENQSSLPEARDFTEAPCLDPTFWEKLSPEQQEEICRRLLGDVTRAPRKCIDCDKPR